MYLSLNEINIAPFILSSMPVYVCRIQHPLSTSPQCLELPIPHHPTLLTHRFRNLLEKNPRISDIWTRSFSITISPSESYPPSRTPSPPPSSPQTTATEPLPAPAPVRPQPGHRTRLPLDHRKCSWEVDARSRQISSLALLAARRCCYCGGVRQLASG